MLKSCFTLFNLRLKNATPSLFSRFLTVSHSLGRKKTWTFSARQSEQAELSLFLFPFPPFPLDMWTICVCGCARECVCTGHFALAEVINTNAHCRNPFNRPPNRQVEVAERNAPCSSVRSLFPLTPQLILPLLSCDCTVMRTNKADPNWI